MHPLVWIVTIVATVVVAWFVLLLMVSRQPGGNMQSPPRPNVALGDEVKDRITGYKGIVIGLHTWLNGCLRVTVQAQELKDGKPVEAVAFDVEQLTVVQTKMVDIMQPSGGPMPAASRGQSAERC